MKIELPSLGTTDTPPAIRWTEGTWLLVWLAEPAPIRTFWRDNQTYYHSRDEAARALGRRVLACQRDEYLVMCSLPGPDRKWVDRTLIVGSGLGMALRAADPTLDTDAPVLMRRCEGRWEIKGVDQ